MAEVERASVSSARLRPGWPRAAALFGVALAASVMRPSVLIAVPFLLLALTEGRRAKGVMLLAVVAAVVVASGARDGMWYAERAWALLVAGWFIAFTRMSPEWRASGRALGAVAASVAAAALVLAVQSGAWATLDFAVTDGIRAGVSRTLETLVLLRGGDPLPSTLATALQETAVAQAEVFPAMLCLASMAAVSVAWWLYLRLSGEGDQGIGPMKDYRFNDHLVWIMIGGILLLVTRWGDELARVGSNAVVFMGALYALRGAAVFMFISGGLSLVGYALLSLGLLFAAPAVLGLAMIVGIGDTWLDVRKRLRGAAA